MKLLLVTLFGVCFLAGCFVQATNPTCADHPIFNMAKPFLARSVSSHDYAKEIMNDFIEEFAKTTPTVLTAEQLGVCSQFAGQSTCCTEKLVKFLDIAASFSGSIIQKAGTPADQIIKLFQKVMVENECSTTLGSMSVEDILSDPANSMITNFYNSMTQGKLPYSQLISQMNRGAMCAICVGVDSITDYMADDKVIISNESFGTLLQSTQKQWAYINSIYTNRNLYTFSIYQLFENYASQECKENKIDNFSDSMLFPYTSFKYQPTDPEVNSNQKCSGKVLFNEKPLCETGQNKAYQMDEFIEDYYSEYFDDSMRQRNLAADTEDAVISEGSELGITCVIPSKTDLLIKSNGDLNVSFAEFSTSSEQSAANTSLSKLEFIASLAIIIFITI